MKLFKLLYFKLLTGDGQMSNPLSTVTGMVKRVTTNVKNDCEMIGSCVKQTGANVMNKTVSVTKETLQTGASAINTTIMTTKDSLKKVPKITSIPDILNKFKCVIPKNADNILRASLLQQCISPSLGNKEYKY